MVAPDGLEPSIFGFLNLNGNYTKILNIKNMIFLFDKQVGCLNLKRKIIYDLIIYPLIIISVILLLLGFIRDSPNAQDAGYFFLGTFLAIVLTRIFEQRWKEEDEKEEVSKTLRRKLKNLKSILNSAQPDAKKHDYHNKINELFLYLDKNRAVFQEIFGDNSSIYKKLLHLMTITEDSNNIGWPTRIKEEVKWRPRSLQSPLHLVLSHLRGAGSLTEKALNTPEYKSKIEKMNTILDSITSKITDIINTINSVLLVLK